MEKLDGPENWTNC